MQSNYFKLSIILLIFKFSIGCDLSFEQLKTCSIMDVGTENYQLITDLNINTLINEKKSDNELYNLRFYLQTGDTGNFLISGDHALGAKDCRYARIYVIKNTTRTTWKGGVRLYSNYPNHCRSKRAKRQKVVYTPVNLNEYIPLPVRIILTKERKYIVYISNKEYLSYTFPETFKPVRFNFRQYRDPKGRARLFYNCKFKE